VLTRQPPLVERLGVDPSSVPSRDLSPRRRTAAMSRVHGGEIGYGHRDRRLQPLAFGFLPLGVIGEALPVDDHARLVAHDPRIVSGSGRHEVAGTELHFLTVVHDDLHPT